MRFIVMHKVDQKMETGAPPSPELISNMGKLIGEGFKTGVVLDGAGLRPSATRTRLRRSGGEEALTNGPYRGENELVAGFVLIKVRSRDEALAWASRFAEALGEAEIELGPVTEPWDLGIAPRPEGEVPLRFLLLNKADQRTEAGLPPSAKEQAGVGRLLEDMRRAGVFLSAEGIQPSAKGARLKFSGGRRTMTDGPFAESKELIAGFAILSMPSLEEALAWTERYAEDLGEVEVDVRPL
jgi:hypothetical protein